jgi:glycerol-3-phosphate dehydrogenase subunit B
MTTNHDLSCDLIVIGAGLAGMAAALFASNRGLDTIQAGIASEIIFASGLMDLLGVHPIETGKTWQNPWKALSALSQDLPHHPYAKLSPKTIQAAFDEFLSFLDQSDLPYHHRRNKNLRVITPLGTAKTTYCVPHSMKSNATAFEKKQPCLIVDIQGLRGFSARQITETLQESWPGLRHVTVSFPESDMHREVYTETMARSLALSDMRRAFSEKIKPHVKDARFVGLPAILGMYRTKQILEDLQQAIGVSLFEIPTMPPSIPGLRIKELFEIHLPQNGVRLFYGHRVVSAVRKGGFFLLKLNNSKGSTTVKSKGVLLASGRFIGKGLRADRTRIKESIFDLPVYQPGERAKWHHFRFLDPSGHPINQAGIEIDKRFRPLNTAGKPAMKNLFAAGSILAHQDWMRMKCGSGLSIATAYAAVQQFLKSA